MTCHLSRMQLHSIFLSFLKILKRTQINNQQVLSYIKYKNNLLNGEVFFRIFIYEDCDLNYLINR